LDASNFGLRLRQLREKAGLTQKELADRARLSQNGISQWEAGKREPAWSAVLALCHALGVDCRAFCGADSAGSDDAKTQRRRPRRRAAR
jgi:transcriptional regulator with XRE-family HTH domain